MLSPEDVEHLIYQATGALQLAHDHELVHQEVKPSHFLIRNRKENPKCPDLLLTGFRITTSPDATASTDEDICGSPAYIAPEQWDGHPVPATDQYALAIMAYQLLTGHPPFRGTPEEVRHQHFNSGLPLTGTLNTHPALYIVLWRALAKKPEDRFPSVLTFAEAFQQALLPESDTSSPTQPALPFDKTQGLAPTSTPLPTPIDTRVDDKGRGLARRTLILLIGLIVVLAGGNIGLL